MSIFLIGSRGCGKTTIGKRLADRLWQPFHDIDALVAKRAGKSIAEIFKTDGEPVFRDMETAVLRELVLLTDEVVALGGGTVLREENRALIKAQARKVIYLRCEPQVLHRRINADPNSASTRPALTSHGGGLAEIRELLKQREPLYREVMTSELDVTNLSVDDAVVYIVRML